VITGKVHERQVSDEELFEQQYEESIISFNDKKIELVGNEPLGFREVTFFPSYFEEKRFSIEALETVQIRASINYRGFPFLYTHPRDATYRIPEGYETAYKFPDFSGNQHFDYWQLITSGFFTHHRLMVEESITEQQDLAYSILGMLDTTHHIGEAVDCLVRMYSALELDDNESITMIVKYTNTKKRLLVRQDGFPSYEEAICQIPLIEIGKSLTLAQWSASKIDIATEIVMSIFDLFNFRSPSSRSIQNDIQRLYERQR